MGFWESLKDASPQHSHARATEIHEAGIREVTPMQGKVAASCKGRACTVCKATFGELFVKNRIPCIVRISSSEYLAVNGSEYLLVCSKCVEHFHFS